MKNLARLSYLLITALWGSYYAVTKVALSHMDPVLFTFFEAVSIAPIGLAFILLYKGELNKMIFRRGIILGSWLCLAMVTVSVAEKFTTATATAFFPSLGGVFATVITGIILHRSISKFVWIAMIFSLLGILIILLTSGEGSQMRGDLIALLGALFFTAYIFLVDHEEDGSIHSRHQFLLVLGVEHLTIVFWMAILALLFGDWQHSQFVPSRDIVVIIYVGTACTFLPVILTNLMQRYLKPLEVSFISTLEPIWGTIIAYLYIGETVSLSVYIGGALVIIGTLLYISTSGLFTWTANIRNTQKRIVDLLQSKQFERRRRHQKQFLSN